jgi:hypothetical protein
VKLSLIYHCKYTEFINTSFLMNYRMSYDMVPFWYWISSPEWTSIEGVISSWRLLNIIIISLYYHFSYLLFNNGSNVQINDESIFKKAKQVYVFMIAFISYPIYSLDFGCITPNITLCKLAEDGWIVKKLGQEDFPNCVEL